MAFAWEEYLTLAESIEQGGHGFHPEAAARSAVSRAYYAAFCYARNFARDNQGFVPTKKARDHYLLREHFRLEKMTQIMADLEDLRIWRNKCDYDDAVEHLQRILSSAVTKARAVVDFFP